jgi:Na+-driven multidrug efflux pump
VLRVFLAVGGALLLVNFTGLGLVGIFYAASFGMLAYGAIMLGALKLGAWRRHRRAL